MDNSPGRGAAHDRAQLMKHIRGCLLLIGFLFFAVASASAHMTLITEENPPFNYTKNGKLTGAATAVVREICRRLGTTDNIQVMPWARGYKRLQTEPNVVLFTTAWTQARAPLFNWVGPLFIVRLGFYARKEDPRRIDSLEAAKNVAAIACYNDDFREQILKSLGFTNLDSSKDPKSDIRKLISGRVDLWFFDNLGAPEAALEAGIDPGKIKNVFTYKQTLAYIAISKRTAPAIVHLWQKTLDEMKADGTFWWLTRKWLPADAIAADQRQTAAGRSFALKLYTENAPPSSYAVNGRIEGLSVGIVREILRRIGRSDTISLVPWARGYRLAQTAADTALFATTRMPQREALFQWVGPLYRQRWGFYRWKGSGIDIGDLDAAKRVKRIGTYYKDAKMQYLKVRGFENLVPTNQNVTNVKHLRRGNIDLWLSSDFNMPYVARQAGVSPDRIELAYAFHTAQNYIAFSKNTSPHVIRLWQAVLDEMKADGSYARICRKYGYEPQSSTVIR
jgi:polar amino acid transport system substrate-binding protein